MARVIPSGSKDETGQNARQTAAAFEALRRLYISLMARREEQERNEQMRLQMLGLQQQHQIGMQERSQQHAYDLEDYRYGGGRNGAGGPNLLGPGAQGLPAPATPTTAKPAAAKPPVFTPNMIPGSVAPLTPGDQFKGAQQQPTIGPNPDKFSALTGVDAMASADTEAFSAQSKPAAPAPTKNQTGVKSPLPKETSSRTRQRPQRDAYLPIDPQWLGYMAQKEKEYGLPQGMLITLYGMENGGGRSVGRNPKSTATGLFQFTADLRKEHGISDQDTTNPAIMIDKAAANLQRNHEVLKSKFGVSLPTTPEAIPVWSLLHQFGAGNGPRIVKALADGHDTPMMQVMIPSKNNYQTLVNNGIDPMTSVKNFVSQHTQKARNWFHSSIQQFQNPNAQQPQQQVQRPPADIQDGGRGSNPRLIRAISGGASLALPDGYSLRQTSGHRPGDSGYHGRREAADFQIVTPDGRAIPNRGEDTTGLYTRLARGVKTWIAENDPGFQVNYGGAHGTQKRGGGVPDLMHYDTGRDRGNMRPDVRMSRLPLLSDEERNAPVQQASAQAPAPVPQVQALPQVQAQAPDASTVAATLPSRGGKVIGNTAAFEKQYGVQPQPSIASLDIFSPTLAANQPTQQQPPTSITPKSSTLSARSDLEYGAQPTTADVPAPIEPQQSTLSARSDLDYGGQAPEQVPLPPERPTDVPQQKQPPPSEDYDLRDDMQTEFTVSAREGSPNVDVAVDQALADLRGDINTRNFPTLPTPGVVAKQDLPPELTPPAAPIQWPPASPAAPSAVARAPVPQEFASVDRGQRPVAAPPDVSASSAQPAAPTRVPGQSIVNAIYSRLPNLSTAEQQGNKGTPPQLPNMPPPSALMPSLPPMPQGMSLEGVGEWLKQNFGPGGAPPAQREFNTKLQDAVRQKFGDVRGAVSGFDPMAFIEKLRYGPKSVKTTTIGPPQAAPQKAPARTMPGGTPYVPDQPPLQLVPPKGGPTNSTLSGGGTSASAVPLPGGSGGTMVKMPDGRIMERRVVNGVPQFVVPNAPEEVTAEQ